MYPGSGLSGEITPLLLLLVSYLSMNWNYNNSSGEGENHRGSLLLPGDDLLVVNELGAIGVNERNVSNVQPPISHVPHAGGVPRALIV